ncbi:MAG: AAA family ATPase [Cyanobacteriota bacterium]|nr:AAA family ATPase [Cyanobacteriota bacterium]
MIASLLQPQAYDHPVQTVRLLETHLSWILLTGDWAYKLRKPVNLGFVDLRSQAARRHCAEEELRLNRRLCPDLYVALRPVYGPPQMATLVSPAWGDALADSVLDVAVQMHQFEQHDLLPARLKQHPPERSLWIDLADRLAGFHGAAAIATPGQIWGSPDAVLEPALANLDVLERFDPVSLAETGLRSWTLQEHQRLTELFRSRQFSGRVREGHGDLHLGNLVVRAGRIDAFDCLEFSPALRWIDVISDLAFLVMDLQHHGETAVAVIVLNRWLQNTGDYRGLWLWRWYLVYRALVRAKVAALRQKTQPTSTESDRPWTMAINTYRGLASRMINQPRGAMVITHGVSGTGKSWLSSRLCEQLGWIHLRSDIERRRRFGRWGQCPEATITEGDAYADDITEWLYGKQLPELAEAISAAGFGVIIDATFLTRHQRDQFKKRALSCGAGFFILDCQGQVHQALRRMESRRQVGKDPSEADETVLQSQMNRLEPLSDQECRLALEGGEPIPWVADGLLHALELKTTR